MAQVKMDLTEYEALKRIEKDLRASLSKSETLQKKIETLQAEKIEAMENAKNQIIKKVETTVTYLRKPIGNTSEVMRNLREFMQSPYNYLTNNNVPFRVGSNGKAEESDVLTALCNNIFKPTPVRMNDYPEVSSNTTIIGLEEAKEEIRKQEAFKVENTVHLLKHQVEEYRKTVNSMEEEHQKRLITKSKTHTKELNTLKEKYDQVVADFTAYAEDHEEAISKLERTNDLVLELKTVKPNILNIGKIKNLINKL